MLQLEHSAILSTFIKLPFVIKIVVVSVFEWPFDTGFAVFMWTHKRSLLLLTGATPSICGDKPTDIVFILDSSSSEGATNFQKQLQFVSDFVKQFDIGPTDVQVGMITFSSYAHSEFYLNR